MAELDAEMATKDATIEQLMAVQSHTAAEKATLIAERSAAVDAASVKATALGASLLSPVITLVAQSRTSRIGSRP